MNVARSQSDTWGPLGLCLSVIAAILLGFTLISHAAGLGVPSPGAPADVGGLLGLLLAGQYLPAVGTALVIGVGILRKGATKLPRIGPWFATQRGGYVLAYATSYALYLGAAWQAGAPWDLHLFLTAFTAALAASGVLDHWRDLLGALTETAPAAIKTSSAAMLALVLVGVIGAVLGGAACGPKSKAVEQALWDCTAPARAEAVAALTPVVISVVKAAGSADGNLIDTSTVKAAMTKANLASEAGVLLACALAQSVAILLGPPPAPPVGSPAVAPYVLDPIAVAKMWAEIDSTQLGGAHFKLTGGRIQ